MHQRVTAFLLLACLAARIEAATIVVSKNGPITSIQDGADAAAAGDTVIVKTGIYAESIAIFANKPGLTLKAAGIVVIDARGFGGLGLGAAISAGSDDMLIRGFTIRNAAQLGAAPGDGIRATGARVHIEKCTLLAIEGTALRLQNVNAVVKNCVVRDAGIGAGLLNAQGANISKCVFDRCVDHAIQIDGSDFVTIEKTTIDATQGQDAIASQNGAVDNLTISGSLFRNCANGAMQVEGTGLRLDANVFRGGRCGVRTNGAFAVISDNAFAQCDANTVALILEDADGAQVIGNRFDDIADIAVFLKSDCSGVVLADNVVTNVGFEREAAFTLDGTSIDVDNCRVLRGGGDGFEVVGDNVTLTDCVAKDCLRDGFDVNTNAATCTLTGCTATRCAAEGFDNSGPSTTVQGCIAKQNRIDIANDGTLAVNNTQFTTGGSATPPQID